VVIVVDQIFWTRGLGGAILAIQNGENANATQEFLDFSLKQIDAMVTLVRCVDSRVPQGQDHLSFPHTRPACENTSLEAHNRPPPFCRSNLTRHQRTLLGALITIDVHARDVVRIIVQKKVSSMIDFEWTRQLRCAMHRQTPPVAWSSQ
jgi:hypothetical protein